MYEALRMHHLTRSTYFCSEQGSITGAYSPLSPDVTPSFILLAIQDMKIVCYVYELSASGDVEVSKSEMTKKQVQQSTNPALLASLLS